MASEDIVIPLMMVIILLIFIIYIIVILIRSGWQRTASATPGPSDARTSSDQAAVTLLECLPQQCAVNLATGLKRCGATPGEVVAVNPAVEVCSNPFTCSDPVLPYALQSDGSTNNLGQCQAGVECRCLRQPRCPQYVTSYFTRSNGDPYSDPLGQRITFPQISSYIDLNTGEVVNSPPLVYNDPNISFCAAPVDWLPFASPGCNFVGIETMTYQDLEICMGAATGCNNVSFNPCLQGTLAVITADPDAINQLTVLNQEVACVAGNACACGEVAIYDTNFGGIVCRTLLPG